MQTVKPKPLPFFVVPLWAVLLVVRAVAAFTGLSYLPMLPSVPAEVLMNDPAVALSRGQGLVGASFAHSINHFDRIYTHFPPVFIFLQSLVYRAFGLSALTLRALGGVDGILAFAVFLLAFREFYRRGFLDRFGLLVGSALLILEPTTLIQARQGRMESTNILFGSLAFLLTLLADRFRGRETTLWIASSLLCGFSLATHPSGMLFVPVLGLWSLSRFSRAGWVKWLGINVAPLAVFGAIWGVAYGAESVTALRRMQHLSGYNSPPSLALGMLANVLRHGAAGQLQQTGGLALVAILAAPLLACVRLLLNRGGAVSGEASGEWRMLLTGAAVTLVVQCATIAWVLPWSGPNRIVMAAPFAFFCFAVALSWLPAGFQRPAAAVAVLFLLAETVVFGGYFLQLHETAECGAERLDTIVDSIPSSARVAAVPEFWYAFRHKGRAFSFIYHGLDESRYWNEVPGAFDEYDAVILDPVEPDYPNLIARARQGKPVESALHTCRREFTLLEKAGLVAAPR